MTKKTENQQGTSFKIALPTMDILVIDKNNQKPLGRPFLTMVTSKSPATQAMHASFSMAFPDPKLFK